MTSGMLHASPTSASDRTRFTITLQAEADLALVGGKAHTLGRLLRVGARVPPGFVLCTGALEAHLNEGGIAGRIESLCKGADFTKLNVRTAVAAAMRSLVCGAALPAAVQAELHFHARALLATGPVVVRSSAVGEDSEGASFAGQLDSILNITHTAALENALLSCWASYWSARALFYRSARGVRGAGMGVVVQQQVDARASGVMFTDDGNGSLLVEYGSGLADALVSGATDPARICINRDSGAVQHLGARNAEADTIVLTRAGIAALRKAATMVERELGSPQDVEWAMTREGTLFLVQSRPITAKLAPQREQAQEQAQEQAPEGAPLLSSPQKSSARQIHWSNANVNENFPAPISPFLYSVASAGYTNYFRNLGRAFGIGARRLRAMQPAFDQIIGVHAARMYYNVTNIHAVIRLAPFGEALASSFNAFVGVTDAKAAPPQARSGGLTHLLEGAVIAARVIWQYAFIERRIQRFEATADAFAARSDPTLLPHKSPDELRALLKDFMDIRCHKWKDAALADTAAMVCYGALQRLIAFGRGAEGAAAHTALLKAIPGVVSGEPVYLLWRLSRMIRADEELAQLFERENASTVLSALASDQSFAAFREAFDDYLYNWGFRCSSELMLTAPSFQEEPEPLIAILRAYARLDSESPLQSFTRLSAERGAETSRALAALARKPVRFFPLLNWSVALRLLLPWTHASIRYRERARLKQALLYSRLRRIALAIGQQLVQRDVLGNRDDVFWFTVTEVDELASGSAMFGGSARATVHYRAHEHARLASITPPDSFTLPEGEYLDTSLTDDTAIADERATTAGGILTGTSACAGRVTGRAVVLTDVTEAERLQEGDVLVTRQTDPGWGPVFFLIAGLVIERGGMLSHGAILAREFGIPCVVGIRDATRLIPDGAELLVDADQGQVHVLR